MKNEFERIKFKEDSRKLTKKQLQNEKNTIIDEMEEQIKCGRKQRKAGTVT